MTRQEHMQWCKDRAIQEFDYYINTGLDSAFRNGITSMMSDISKHPETKGEGTMALCTMQLMTKPSMSRQEFVNFINGFH